MFKKNIKSYSKLTNTLLFYLDSKVITVISEYVNQEITF